MIRFVIKTIQILLAIVIFWVATAFGSALFFAFTSPYPSCTIRQYIPCSLQLEYFFLTFVISLIVNPFTWVQPSLSLKDLPLTLSGLICGTGAIVCFFKFLNLVDRQLQPSVNVSQVTNRPKNVKREYSILIFTVTILLIGMVSLQLKLTNNSNSTGILPKELEDVQVLTSIVATGFGEGCYLYIFELKSSVSNKIKEIGITYFESDNKLRSDSSLKSKNTNPYSQWRSTPVPKDSYSWRALSYGKETDRELITRIRSGMERTGGYYIMTKNQEGVIVVLPKENLAAELYFG